MPKDRVVFYVSRKYQSEPKPAVRRFMGIGTVTSKSFIETKKIWEGSSTRASFPVRISFRPDIVNEGVLVTSLLD
jgi:hypothetical protein